MASKRILIFANPIAGRGRGEAIARRLARALARRGDEPLLWLAPPTELSAEQLGHDVHTAIAIGGDGTIRGVAERLHTLRAHGDESIPMLIVPLGTANLLGQHLGVRWRDADLEQRVLAAIDQRHIVQLDAARANDKLFLLMVGVGFDAAVVHELSRVRRGPISLASYFLPAAKTVAQYSYPKIDVWIDGVRRFSERGVVFVGNIKEYGTGFPMLPLARPDDGQLDVCCIPCANVVDAGRMFLLAAAGEHLGEEGVVYEKASRVRIEAPDTPAGLPIQIDGDPAGHTPVEIELLSARLPMVVP